jgi:hypothetical protein
MDTRNNITDDVEKAFLLGEMVAVSEKLKVEQKVM